MSQVTVTMSEDVRDILLFAFAGSKTKGASEICAALRNAQPVKESELPLVEDTDTLTVLKYLREQTDPVREWDLKYGAPMYDWDGFDYYGLDKGDVRAALFLLLELGKAERVLINGEPHWKAITAALAAAEGEDDE